MTTEERRAANREMVANKKHSDGYKKGGRIYDRSHDYGVADPSIKVGEQTLSSFIWKSNY